MSISPRTLALLLGVPAAVRFKAQGGAAAAAFRLTLDNRIDTTLSEHPRSIGWNLH